MKRCFVCLANSKKYGERCIAGIELAKGQATKYEIVKKEDKPKWIRPVTREAQRCSLALSKSYSVAGCDRT